MKQFMLVLACTAFSVYHAADLTEETPLLGVSIDGETTHTPQKTRTLYPIDQVVGHITVENQELKAIGLNIGSLDTMRNFQQKLSLNTITKAYFNNNGLDEQGFRSILTNMPQLTFLDVSGNNIKRIPRPPHHAQLQTLLLHNNKIERLPLHSIYWHMSALKQLSLHGNLLTPQNIIVEPKIPSPTIEELYFDSEALDEKLIAKIIAACPRLTAEITSKGDAIQTHYSKIEQQYDVHDTFCNGKFWIVKYGILALAGGVVGAAAAIIIDGFHLGNYYAAFIPASTIVTPLGVRIGLRIYGYCNTKPEDRYITVKTRNIAKTPTLLTLIKPYNPMLDPDQEEMVNPSEIPDQEQEE